MEPTSRAQYRPDGSVYIPKKVDGMDMLRQWRNHNYEEYVAVLEYQARHDEPDNVEENLSHNTTAEHAHTPEKTTT
jgi:hypothetical protein